MKLNINSKIDYIGLITMLFIKSSMPSSCDPESQYFLENIHERQIIAHVEILDIIKYENDYNKYLLDGVTKLKVIKSFRNELFSDTIIHYDHFQGGHGTTFQFNQVGDEFLLKTNIIKPINTLKELSIFGNDYLTKSDTIVTNLCRNYLTVSAHVCDHAIIPIQGDLAVGMITKNTINKLFSKYERIKNRNYDKGEDFFERRILNEELEQTISISNCYRLIHRKLKADKYK